MDEAADLEPSLLNGRDGFGVGDRSMARAELQAELRLQDLCADPQHHTPTAITIYAITIYAITKAITI